MRQLLILGFYCEVYKKEPLCRVYINDVFVDEFNIPQCDKRQLEIDPLDPDPLDPHITNPLFLKYIEFDDADADSLDVVLKIKNDDNNHANGYMSKFTNIILSHVYLTSKKVLENIDNLLNNFKFCWKNWNKLNRNIVDYYTYSHRHRLFENFVHDAACNFPGIQLKSDQYVGQYKIGSSGYFHFSLRKKLGFWRQSTNCRGGFWRLGSVHYMKYLYDKYKGYEDTRNTDQ
jgi:hypothetical protein